MNPLLAEILDEIDRKGAMLFSRFMELSLYHPRFGYYEKGIEQIGKKGDFTTSVSCGNLFGCLLAEQMIDWSKKLFSANEPFTMIEAGSHDGQLAEDILGYLKEDHPTQYERISYVILEPSPARSRIQKRRLIGKHSNIQWLSSWNQVPPKSVEGVIFCNELLDAFPVERISWDASKRAWFPWSITRKGDQLCWHHSSESYPYESYPYEVISLNQNTSPLLKKHLPNGFTTELTSRACDWWKEAGRRIRRGYLMGIDYGLTREERLSPHRHQGTLRAYKHHMLFDELLKHPGEFDLTAHVDFTAIKESGRAAGLIDASFQSQERFLMKIAHRLIRSGSPVISQRLDQLKTLIHPNHFGHFSVIIQKHHQRQNSLLKHTSPNPPKALVPSRQKMHQT